MSLETQLLMKQLMSQYFLLLNGKRAMTADLKMGGFKLLNCPNVLSLVGVEYFVGDNYITDIHGLYPFKSSTAGYDIGSPTKIWNRICVKYINKWGLIQPTNNATIATANDVAKYIAFTSHNGAIQVTNMKLLGGNVLMENLPVADPHVVGALWNDAGTVKVSAG